MNDTELAALQAGAEAALDGQPITDNPYGTVSESSPVGKIWDALTAWWSLGWKEGRESQQDIER